MDLKEPVTTQEQLVKIVKERLEKEHEDVRKAEVAFAKKPSVPIIPESGISTQAGKPFLI